MILHLDPNGDAPMTAMLGLAASEKTTDPIFHWFTRKQSQRRASGTAGAFVYKNTNLSTAYAANDDFASGTTVYVKMAAIEAKEYVAGKTVLLRDSTDFSNDIRGRVTSVTINGASSYITVTLLQADGTGSGDLSDCDTAIVLASAFAQGSEGPDGVAYDPTHFQNNTQIFKTALQMTRTTLQTKLRTGDYYTDQKTLALLNHSIDLENALLFNGPATSGSEGGQPLYTTEGLLYWINSNVPANYESYKLTTDTDYAGKTWLQGGQDWIDEKLKDYALYTQGEVTCYCGNTVLQGINRLARQGGDFKLEAGQTDYGTKVKTWESPYGLTIHFKTHPRFNYEPTMRDAALFVQPKNMKFRYIQDTMFKPDKSYKEGGYNKVDGLREEWITEAGYEFHHPDTFMFLYGFNGDNAN